MCEPLKNGQILVCQTGSSIKFNDQGRLQKDGRFSSAMHLRYP